MNTYLQSPLDSFLFQFSKYVNQTSVGCGHSSFIRFSNRGDFLASGRTDGKIIIFDWETYGIARKLRGHSGQVTSMSWSKDDRYLLSTSIEWTTILWDLQTSEPIRKIRFNGPCLQAALDPLNPFRFVVGLLNQDAILVDITEEEAKTTTLSSIPIQSDTNATNKKGKTLPSTTTLAFIPTGGFFLTGTNTGWLNVHSADTGDMLASVQLTNAMLKMLRLTSSGKHMIVMAEEKVIRQYEMPDFSAKDFEFQTFHLEPEGTILDAVNKTQPYNHATCSNTGEYVITTEKNSKSTSVYARGANGLTLLSLLDPPEQINFLEWHPHRACVCAIAVSDGRIYVYSYLTPQKWSALAPDFVEVEENIEYTEEEDEFDIPPPEELHQRRLDLEDEDVDVLTFDDKKPGQWQPGDFVIPVIMDIDASDSDDDMVAVGAGQYRRKTSRMWADEDSEAVPSGDESRRTPVNGRGGKRKRYHD
jgi:COMPASS component SWD1